MSIMDMMASSYAVSRTRKYNRVINFNAVIKGSQTAVFLMPRMSMEFYLARSVVESLMKYFGRIVLVVTENMRELATYRSEVISFSQKDANFLKLPSNDLISRLRSEKIDLAFDLSFSEDIFMSYLCRMSDAQMTVGFSKPNSERFYDLQVRQASGADMKDAYESLKNTIRMFKEK